MQLIIASLNKLYDRAEKSQIQYDEVVQMSSILTNYNSKNAAYMLMHL